jgi:transposase-like protein
MTDQAAVKAFPGRRGHSKAFRATVVAAIKARLAVRYVAGAVGISTSTVWLWCKAAGVAKRKGLPPRCHPDRKAFGKGYCAPCYKRLWNMDGHVEPALTNVDFENA